MNSEDLSYTTSHIYDSVKSEVQALITFIHEPFDELCDLHSTLKRILTFRTGVTTVVLERHPIRTGESE